MISPALSAAARLDFNRDVRPILADTCFECHGPDEKARKGKLRLDTPEGALRDDIIVAGKSDVSELYRRLISADEDEVMPPVKAHRKPTREQIAKLQRWIDEGANYDEHWSFVPPARPPLPPVADPVWCRTPIDRFVLARLDAAQLKPRPAASPEVLARRLSLALNGLPPTVEELDAFTTRFLDDPDRAVTEWVDELLRRPAYGEHFAWGWMDASRYSDTNGYQSDGERVMWRWRDWLIDSLNANKRFDRFTREMLAGDLLLPAPERDWSSGDVIRDPISLEKLMATGFLRNHRYDTGSGTIPDESRFENAADRLETFSTVWLGLTLQCARCHDHKFDPILARDYYSLMAFFDKIPEWGMAMRKASHPYIHAPTGAQREQLLQLDNDVQKAQQALREAETRITAAQSRWENSLKFSGAESRPPHDVARVKRGLQNRYMEQEPSVFDGTTTHDMGQAANKLITGDTRWTVSFWFRAIGGADATLFSNVDRPEATYVGLFADLVGGKLRLRHVCRWVNSYVEFISDEPVKVGVWHQVTFSSDGRGQGMAYSATLDGRAEDMRLTEGSTGDNMDGPLKGKLVLGGGPFLPKFKGELADLRFYNRDLMAEEKAFLAERRTLVELAAVPIAQRSTAETGFLRLHFLEAVAENELRQLQDEVLHTTRKRDEFIRSLPPLMVMQQGAGRQTHLHTKGAYDKPAEPVNAMTPAVLPRPATAQPDRVALADWLMRPDHPLTARVAVNRLWQQLWGRGFTDTPENFGTQCAQPLHHELLDWLATEYIRLGWDTKAMIKLITTSAVYQQDSAAPAESWKSDPDNRLLSRGPRFRLPVGMVRDSALAISGLLQRQVGGPSVLLEPLLNQDNKEVKLPFVVDTTRRTLYTFWKRNAPHPMLAVFDIADRNQCDVRVRRTNTPLQALVTLNEPGQAACAEAFARRIEASATTDDARLAWAFRAATSRTPGTAQLGLLRESLATQRAVAEDDHAAWNAVANVLLNLDATLTLE